MPNIAEAQPNVEIQKNQVKTDITELKTSAEKAASLVSQEFQHFLADIETLVKSLTSLTGSELEVAKAQLNARIASGKIRAAEISKNVAQQARDTMNVTDTYVREQPWKAVGITAGISFLLGFVLARRS